MTPAQSILAEDSDMVLAFITENPGCKSAQVLAATKIRSSRLDRILSGLRKAGEIRRSGQKFPFVWEAGNDNGEVVDGSVSRRRVTKTWTPNHERMDLVAALFGEAAIPRSALAGA